MEKKEKVLIYGVGRYFEQHRKDIYAKYDVIGYVDSVKTGILNGIKIMDLNDIKFLFPTKILT